MMNNPRTLIVCSKCGKTAEFYEAQAAGWLYHQIADAPQGHVIIRCPAHVTGHALRLAGLPQQVSSKRIADNLERGLWAYTQSGRIASVRAVEDEDGTTYHLGYGRDHNPPDSWQGFDTLESLIAAMREVEPDLRRWKLTEAE